MQKQCVDLDGAGLAEITETEIHIMHIILKSILIHSVGSAKAVHFFYCCCSPPKKLFISWSCVSKTFYVLVCLI